MVDSKKTLFLVAGALLLLLGLTVAMSFVDLGGFSFPLAIGIAAAKAILVVWFFMEVRHSGPVIHVAATAGILWLALLIFGTVSDLLTRIPLQITPH
jgi:cytochrome c oxidase subunit 4